MSRPSDVQVEFVWSFCCDPPVLSPGDCSVWFSLLFAAVKGVCDPYVTFSPISTQANGGRQHHRMPVPSPLSLPWLCSHACTTLWSSHVLPLALGPHGPSMRADCHTCIWKSPRWPLWVPGEFVKLLGTLSCPWESVGFFSLSLFTW